MTANGVYSFCVEHSPEGNRVPLWRAIDSRWNKDSLGSSHDSSDLSADLLDQLDDQVVPCTSSLDCHSKEDTGVLLLL